MDYKKLTVNDLSGGLLDSFNHNQRWTKQWIKDNDQWLLCDVTKSREWDQEKRKWIINYLSEQIERGGFVFGAFNKERIVGFSAVDGILRGRQDSYANLTMLFVDDEYQRRGIGKTLVSLMKKEAVKLGASKLFVSAIPAEETVSFYIAMGFKDSEEAIPDFIDTDEDRLFEINVGDDTEKRLQ